MKRLTLVCVGVPAILAALAFVACGDVSGTNDLFTAGSGGAGSGGAAASTTGHGATTASSGGSSATTASATVSSSGATTTTSSVASSTASSTSSTAASSAGGPPPVQVDCNGGACQPGQICCFNPNGPGDHCGDPGHCAQGWAELDCNGPEDCPGGSCCATVDVNKQVPYLGMKCAPSCNPGNQVVVCSVQDPGVCPMGTQCQTSQSLGAGYDVCWPGG